MEAAMGALRSAAIEPDSTAELEIGIMRAWRHERRTQSVNFWMPTLLCAVIAAGLTLAVIQLALSPQSSGSEKKTPALSRYTDRGDYVRSQ